MTSPMRVGRFGLMLGLCVVLSACGLPRAGPYFSEIVGQDEESAAELPFHVVDVTADVVAMTRVDERLGFSNAFLDAGHENTAVIKSGDVLTITVWESIDQGLLNPDGTGATPLPNVKVDERGMVFVPYVGLVKAEGRTLNQLRETIRAQLAERTLNPQVDIFPVSTTARSVNIQGEVNAPGVYTITDATGHLLPMLAQAGGVRTDPEVIRIRVRRGTATGEVWLQDLYDDPAMNIPVRQGDTVIAERDRRTFTALGAVGGQSTQQFPTRELTVIAALGRVGGLVDWTSDPTGVFLFRSEAPEVASRVVGTESFAEEQAVAYIIDLTKPGGMFLARDFMMRDGDTLYVTTAPFVQWQKVLSAVAPVVGFSGAARTLTRP